MRHTYTAWTQLAARTARGLLARKGVAYQDLATKLSNMGIPESLRSVESKIQRGSFRLDFFIATLRAVNAEYPPQWKQFVESDMPAKDAAVHILLHEIGIHGVRIDDLSIHLRRRGVSIEHHTLTTYLTDGDVPFTLLLQLALVAPLGDLCRFVDQSDIEAAAVSSNASIKTS
ncbi:DUF6471 domain-containing protein [Cupriavidus numazuensis]|uniref:DUF6471 domain-containing protein n=1 Tax=Cupriavidus numazuensis TaxID=221992 RepID=UPI001FD23A34|nr:DUF6471 domain-containing protein [Cupriavidus numazuensis]